MDWYTYDPQQVLNEIPRMAEKSGYNPANSGKLTHNLLIRERLRK